ncbi:MAG: peptidylprolyl isomerase [Cyanobacteria bacterium P01_D01_bin.156]
MEPAIQVGAQILNTPELVQKIRQYRLLPQLVKELVIDQLIGGITCDQQVAYEYYCTQNNLLSDEQRQAWCQQHQLEPQHLVAEALRAYRLHRFKEDTWGSQIQSIFMQNKAKYDRAIYSLLRTKDVSLAQELYFRLRDDKVSFANLAKQYSQGKEAQTGGMVGPVELGTLHPNLARILQIIEPQELWPPEKLGDWLVIVRLEKFVPARLDEAMRQRLLNEQFQALLNQKMQASPTKLLPKVALPTKTPQKLLQSVPKHA